MKKFFALLLALFTCVSMAACGSASDVTIDINKLAEDLNTKIAFQDTLEKIDGEMVQMVYDVDGVATGSVVYMGSGATAEEIAVFECADANTAKNTLKPIVDQHIADQITSFESYVPGEVAKLKNAVVVCSGKYVAVCVTDDAANAKSIIEDYLK